VLNTRVVPTPKAQAPPKKQWYDKVADAILGDDDGTGATAAASRYALICQRCFAHNGLVPERAWEETRTSSFMSLAPMSLTCGYCRVRVPEMRVLQPVCTRAARRCLDDHALDACFSTSSTDTYYSVRAAGPVSLHVGCTRHHSQSVGRRLVARSAGSGRRHPPTAGLA
jgi:hypothetical protein